MTTEYDPKKYGELLLDTLPGVIETEEENEKALAIVDRVMSKGDDKISPEEYRLLDLLVKLIEDFEDKAYPMGNAAKPVDILRSLIDEHGLKQKDLTDIFGSQSVVSEVLNRKRSISKTHARKLAERFNLTADLFI
jgi:HTH-type transcriptional regulator / antitoxin HigA